MADNARRARTRLTDLVAEEIRALLGRKRMSGRELARRLGESPSWVNYRLTGQTPIDLNDLQRFAEVLEVPLVDLLPGQKVANTLRNRDSAESTRSTAKSADRPPREPKRQRTRPAGTTPKAGTRRPVMLSRPLPAL